MATFSDSNRASLRFIKEGVNTWGVTPASGVTKEMRITSSSIAASKETVVSDELRSDRMVSAVTEVSASTAGDFNFEYSAGAQDDFLEYFLLGAYTKAVPFFKFEGTTVSITSATEVDIVGGDYTDYFANGEYVRLSGFESAVNNDYALVGSSAFASNTTTLTVSGPTLVAESDNSKAKVQSADDVIIQGTTVSASATGFADSANPFTALETAGEVVVGQKINVTGLGHETGTFTSVSEPADGETITVDDGQGGVVTFEFDTSANGVAVGNVAITGSATPATQAATIAGAIMAQHIAGNLNCTAAATAAVTTVKNLGPTGGTLAENTATGVTVVNFSGGDDTVNGIFTITSIANGELGVTPTPGTASAGAKVTIQASMLRNPSGVAGGTLNHEVITAQSATIETGFQDVGQYFLHDGMRAGSFSLSVASGSIVTGTIGVQGKETTRSATETLTGGGYTVLDAPANQVMNATTNVGAIKLNGIALSTALQSIEISGESSLRTQNAVGSKFPSGIGTGRFNLTGSVTAYFENADLYTAFINHDTVSLSFDFTDLDNNVVSWTLPAVKFSADPISPQGIDQDVLENIEWMAFRDVATKAMVQIDRFSNVTPVGSQA